MKPVTAPPLDIQEALPTALPTSPNGGGMTNKPTFSSPVDVVREARENNLREIETEHTGSDPRGQNLGYKRRTLDENLRQGMRDYGRYEMARENANALKAKDGAEAKGGAEHNGPQAHVAKSGIHYGAHEGHEAICSQKGYELK